MKRSTRREFLRRSTAGGFSVAVAGRGVAGEGTKTTPAGDPEAIAARYRDNVYTRRTRCLREGEEVLVARRLREFFKASSRG